MNTTVTYPSLLEQPTREMTQEETHTFLHLSMADKTGKLPTLKAAEYDVLLQGPYATMALGRMRAHNLLDKLSLGLFLWLLHLGKGNPGNLVIWCWTLHQIAKRDGASMPLTCEDWGMLYFPRGVPTEESYSTVWVAQKTDTSNALDLRATWE